MTSPADLGWGDPRALTDADMVTARIWPGHVVRVRNDDVAVVMAALVRRLRAAGWPGPDATLDESGYVPRLKRWAEAKYRAQGLTEAQWLKVAPLSEWSDHAWGTAIDLDTAANPMLATRPADPQAHTTMPMAACPGIAAALGLEHGGSWTTPWDPQHWQVAVTPQRLAQIAAPVRRSMEVLDYSSGYPTPSAVKTAGYAGVVRYIGTPGHGKNLTRTEAQAMRAAGIPIALVYEAAAGWMRGGAPAGAAAARAALADAASCGVQARCVYLACDEDVTTQMPTVLACLDGAAGVLGRSRVGVYGEADVIDAALPAHATWGWQTRAWSGGRVSAKAHLLQQTGYVYPGGVQSDRSTILRDDWGYWPLEDDVTADEVWAKPIDYPTYGADVPHAKDAYTAAEYVAGISVTTGRLMQGQAAQTKALAALGAQQAAVLDVLHQLTGGAVPIDYDRVQAAARAGADEALSHLRLVTDDTPPAA